MLEKEAEIEFQKLPLSEREKFVSVVQVWNKAFVSGAILVSRNAQNQGLI